MIRLKGRALFTISRLIYEDIRKEYEEEKIFDEDPSIFDGDYFDQVALWGGKNEREGELYNFNG